jgi:outer membrane phospholipase A
MTSAAVWAGAPLLSLETLEAAAGETVRFTVLWAHDGARPLSLPAKLPDLASLREADRAVDVPLDCERPGDWPQTLTRGQFASMTCRFVLPAGFTRAVSVRIDTLDARPVLLALRPQAPSMALLETPATPAAVRAETAPADTRTPDIFRSAISSHEPMYFSVGGNPDGNTNVNAKFQISLKFRLFRPTDYASDGRSIADDVYFGYTQTSLWDLESPSKPFFDTSYRPALFYARDNLGQLGHKGPIYGLETGLEHESNGKGGTDSRSINIAYVRPMLRFALGADYGLMLGPKLYAYLDKSENPDITDYRGYGDFLLRLEKEKYWRLDTTLRKGSRSGKGSVQMDFSYPLSWISLGNLNGYLHLQYFNGYGESILSYDQRFDPQYRIGLMLVR